MSLQGDHSSSSFVVNLGISSLLYFPSNFNENLTMPVWNNYAESESAPWKKLLWLVVGTRDLSGFGWLESGSASLEKFSVFSPYKWGKGWSHLFIYFYQKITHICNLFNSSLRKRVEVEWMAWETFSKNRFHYIGWKCREVNEQFFKDRLGFVSFIPKRRSSPVKTGDNKNPWNWPSSSLMEKWPSSTFSFLLDFSAHIMNWDCFFSSPYICKWRVKMWKTGWNGMKWF